MLMILMRLRRVRGKDTVKPRRMSETNLSRIETKAGVSGT